MSPSMDRRKMSMRLRRTTVREVENTAKMNFAAGEKEEEETALLGESSARRNGTEKKNGSGE